MKSIIRYIYLPIILTGILSACNSDPEGIYGTITPVQVSSMPGTGRASAVAFSINGKGYIVTGRNNNQKDSLKQLWEYDPATDKWTEKKSFPGKPRVKAIAVELNGKAYVGLGFQSNAGAVLNQKGYFTDFWCYDPVSDSWEKLAGFPGGDTSGCFYFVMNNCIYVGSGYAYLTMKNFLWCYYPEDNRWVRLNDLPGDNRFGSVGCSDGEKAFYGAGFKAENMNDWWEYDVVKDTWRERRSIPGKRVNGTALAVNNRFFVSSGRYFNGNYNLINPGKLYNDILEYEPERNRWHQRGEIPGGPRENAVSFVIGSKAYIGFGENDEGVLNDLWCFEP